MYAFEGKAGMKTYSTLGKSGHRVAALPGGLAHY
jgi:hypothetical protein